MKNSIFALLMLGVAFLTACETVADSGVNSVPVITSQSPPQYPFELHRAGVTGEAVIQFIVDSNGDVRAAHVVAASHPAFGFAAAAAVSRWKFKPGIKNGRPVNTRLQLPIYFTLTDDPAPAPEKKN